jgi:hypothetical protein
MSEDKQVRGKRIAAPKPIAAPAVALSPEAEIAPAAALPAPEPVAALPAPPLPQALPKPQEAADKLLKTCHATVASVCASQAAVASDVAAMVLEIGGLTRSNLTAAGDSVTALLGSRNLADAFDIQLGFARRSLDAMVTGSTKLSEIGLRLANDATKPMLGGFSAS